MNTEFKNKRVLIAGKGVSGQGAYEALTAAGAVCAYAEDEKEWGKFAAELIVVSPGIDCEQPVFTFAKQNSIPLMGEVEVGACLNGDKPIIAVTGTNGKTTVTRLIGEIITRSGRKPAVCGNVGSSFSLAASGGNYDCAVVEVSSFQLETIVSFRPHIAVITNITPDHLDRHKTMKSYCTAKLRIAENQTEKDYLVLSQDDIPLSALEGFAPKSFTLYTSANRKLIGAYTYNGGIYYNCERICDVDRVKIEGEHNIKNALSAVCAAKAFGIRNESIVDALTSFTTDSHRLRLVARIRGKNYYNDSKGTNIAASVCAARAMSGSTCMIVGGSDKGYEYDELFEALPKNIVRVAAVGQTALKVRKAALRAAFENVRTFNDFTAAFEWAASGNEENVLLSPASASFDMFSSYAERGEVFERLVRNVK